MWKFVLDNPCIQEAPSIMILPSGQLALGVRLVPAKLLSVPP
jgi:hypothetical protein